MTSLLHIWELRQEAARFARRQTPAEGPQLLRPPGGRLSREPLEELAISLPDWLVTHPHLSSQECRDPGDPTQRPFQDPPPQSTVLGKGVHSGHGHPAAHMQVSGEGAPSSSQEPHHSADSGRHTRVGSSGWGRRFRRAEVSCSEQNQK